MISQSVEQLTAVSYKLGAEKQLAIRQGIPVGCFELGYPLIWGLKSISKVPGTKYLVEGTFNAVSIPKVLVDFAVNK